MSSLTDKELKRVAHAAKLAARSKIALMQKDSYSGLSWTLRAVDRTGTVSSWMLFSVKKNGPGAREKFAQKRRETMAMFKKAASQKFDWGY